MAWMKAKISANELLVEHRAGTDNVADLFTKCLGTKDFLRHRTSLGFETPEVPISDLQRVRDVLLFNHRVDQKHDTAFVEVCCGTNSALREACRVARMPYLGVVKRMETAEMFQKVKEFVTVQEQLGYTDGCMCMLQLRVVLDRPSRISLQVRQNLRQTGHGKVSWTMFRNI